MPRVVKLVMLIGTMFVLTGATALLIEQVFEKLLTTVVGASTPAGSLVLAVYFAGLCLGGLLYGRFRRIVRHPLRLYGALEGFVALFAVVLALVFPYAQSLSASIVHLAGGSAAATFFMRLLVAAVWILPPTLAMGATFPAIVGVLECLSLPRLSAVMAALYAANLFGAMLGALAGPYVLFANLGLIGTLVIIACVQLVIVAVAFALARRSDFSGLERARTMVSFRDPLLRLTSRREGRLLLFLAATSGFVIFGLEVTWIHLIGTVVGMSVYAFALMLTHVLGGLFVGGLIATAIRPSGTTLSPLGYCVALLTASIVVSLTGALWDDIPQWMLANRDFATTFARAELLRFGVSFVVTGLPAIALGVVYPLLFRLPWFDLDDASPTAGFLGAANAVGSFMGALVVAFVFLPAIGSEATFHLFALIPALVAIVVVISDRLSRQQDGDALGNALPHLAVGAAVIVATWLNMGQLPWSGAWITSGVNVYFAPGFTLEQGQEIVFWHEDSAGGITTVIERRSEELFSGRTLLTNGKFQGNNTGEVLAQVGIGLVPVAHQTARGSALVIGLGTGVSARVISDAGYRRVDIAELAPGIVKAASEAFNDVNGGVLTRDHVALHIEDGRNHLLRTDHRYDLIALEISSIWFAGATSLYSEEFYRLAKSRLTERGLLQQWIQLHHIGVDEVQSTLATARTVFSHVGLWFVGGQAIIVAGDAPLEIDEGSLTSLREDPSFEFERSVLSAFRISIDHVVGSRVLVPSEVDALFNDAHARGVPINTDGNRYLEYATPRYNHERTVDHKAIVLQFLMRFVDERAREERLRAISAE
jgi:spermidine synthase